MHTITSKTCRRNGLAVAETIVVAVLVAIVVMLLLMYSLSSREQSRRLACASRLRDIGELLILHDQATGALPTIAALAGDGRGEGAASGFETLFKLELADSARQSEAGAIVERIRSGLVCPSDPNALADRSGLATSFRFNTGDDIFGRGGPFAPGAKISIEAVEAGDGAQYTVAVSERLVGDQSTTADISGYRLVDGPIDAAGCPPAPAGLRGDAGRDRRRNGWRDTLYNHSAGPQSFPACITADGLAARLSATSGHPGLVQALMLDGGVRSWTATTDLKIWAEAATVGIAPKGPNPPRILAPKPASAPTK